MLARVGLQDNAVSPWFVRRMARMLTEVGVNVTLDLVAGKEHWWWDTDAENDGGVNNDPRVREFLAELIQGGAGTHPPLPPQYEVVSHNPATQPGGRATPPSLPY